MRSPEWLIAIVMMGLSSACNTSARSDPAMSEAPPASEAESAVQAEQEVRQAHGDYYRMLVEEGSDAALVRYYGDDFTYLGVDGKFIDKQGLRARMLENELQHFELEDDLRRVSVYGDVAVLSGHSTSRVTDRVRQVAATEGYTEMWVRRGDWELVAEQITLQR